MLQAAAGPGRDGLEPAHGGGAQAAAVQPPPQEGSGDRVNEAEFRLLTHGVSSRTNLVIPVLAKRRGWLAIRVTFRPGRARTVGYQMLEPRGLAGAEARLKC